MPKTAIIELIIAMKEVLYPSGISLLFNNFINFCKNSMIYLVITSHYLIFCNKFDDFNTNNQ